MMRIKKYITLMLFVAVMQNSYAMQDGGNVNPGVENPIFGVPKSMKALRALHNNSEAAEMSEIEKFLNILNLAGDEQYLILLDELKKNNLTRYNRVLGILNSLPEEPEEGSSGFFDPDSDGSTFHNSAVAASNTLSQSSCFTPGKIRPHKP